MSKHHLLFCAAALLLQLMPAHSQALSLPACDQPNTLEKLQKAVANTPNGRAGLVELIDIGDIRDNTNKVVSPGSVRYCEAKALLNYGKRVIIYTVSKFTPTSDRVVIEVTFISR